jgi:hypothetical protein
MDTPNSPPMPSDEALIPTAKLGRPPIPGTDGTDEVGAGAGAGDASVDTLTESLATALVSAKRFEIEIKEKVSTKTLNKVILLKRSTPHFTGLGK